MTDDAINLSYIYHYQLSRHKFTLQKSLCCLWYCYRKSRSYPISAGNPSPQYWLATPTIWQELTGFRVAEEDISAPKHAEEQRGAQWSAQLCRPKLEDFAVGICAVICAVVILWKKTLGWLLGLGKCEEKILGKFQFATSQSENCLNYWP